jgi:hypothetical protein
MISTLGLALALGVGAVAGGSGVLGGWKYRERQEKDAAFDALLEDSEDGSRVTLPVPETSTPLLGLWRQKRHRQKEKKLAKRGYVKWYKLDGMLRRPQWIKPNREGSGIPKYYDSDDDVHYLFPKDPLVTDSRTGAPVAIHHRGEVEPVNVAEPEYPPIDADRLEEAINLEIESEPPSWLSKFGGLDGETIMWLMIVGVLGFAAFQQFVGGA